MAVKQGLIGKFRERFAMLFIHYSLSLGGIETFYVRMARARARMGLRTRILLLGPRRRSDPGLLAEAQRHGEVLFLEDYVRLPRCFFRYLPIHFLLILPLRWERLAQALHKTEMAHVSSAILGVFYYYLASRLRVKAPLTVGVYHSREFIWQYKGGLPYYERFNRHFIFDTLGERNLVFFSDRLPQKYREELGLPLEKVTVFPLGVVEHQQPPPRRLRQRRLGELSIVSVGRLVDFKTYNIWMLDVVRQLREGGIRVRYDIFGEGPLEKAMRERIVQLGLSMEVRLLGALDYARFAEEVARYDVFVGSGTAVVEAASLGVPSIIGIESLKEPLTYGFLSNIQGFTYNEDGLYPKVPVVDLLARFANLDSREVADIERAHVKKAGSFSMDSCVESFDELASLDFNAKHLDWKGRGGTFLRYSLSYFAFSLGCRLRGSSLSRVVYG